MPVTATAVKALRERTGLPMMECKKALGETDGDENAAVEWLRARGQQVAEKRADRETAFGRFGIYCGVDNDSGAMVEFKCESAPVTQNEEFIQLANDLAEALAKNADVEGDCEKLMALDCPSNPGTSLGAIKDDLFNRIREVFNVGRMVRIEGATAGYSHNSSTVAGVLLGVEGGSDEVGRDIAMHVAAMNPSALSVDELDADVVTAEKNVLREAAIAEGKPENIVDKMVEGRMKNFYAERVLLEQTFVKAENKETVGEFAKSNGMLVKQFSHMVLGE
ncbi:MAG: translation elongation factor Ts [Planctomycetota bacterium]|nr:translation elongation factor Ts [Planctomycetota bacterium]